MRSLATTRTDIPAGGFAGIERLKDVRVEDGWVTAKRGAESEPLDEYFSGRKPHIKFAELPQTTNALVQFCEQYGAVVENQSRTVTFPVQLGIDETFRARAGGEPRNTVTFPEAMFWLEQWRFSLLVKLASARNESHQLRAQKIRTVLRKALDETRGRCWQIVSAQARAENEADHIRLFGEWQSIVREVHKALDAPEPQDPNLKQIDQAQDDSGALAAQYARLLLETSRQHLARLDDRGLVRAATKYLRTLINRELEPLKPVLDFDSEDEPQLYSLCDNLKQRLYWMLALDLAGRRLPRVCVSCGDLFPAPKENAVYCRKLKCRERKRKKRNWEKHKEEYNRSRRRKYKAERLRETRRERQ